MTEIGVRLFEIALDQGVSDPRAGDDLFTLLNRPDDIDGESQLRRVALHAVGAALAVLAEMSVVPQY